MARKLQTAWSVEFLAARLEILCSRELRDCCCCARSWLETAGAGILLRAAGAEELDCTCGGFAAKRFLFLPVSFLGSLGFFFPWDLEKKA